MSGSEGGAQAKNRFAALINRSWPFVKAFFPRLLAVLGAGITSVCSTIGLRGDPNAFWSTSTGRFAMVGLGLLVGGELWASIRTFKYENDKFENDTLHTALVGRQKAMDDLVRGVLRVLCQGIGCGADDRVSLYKRRNDGSFRLVGRYSQNQQLTTRRRETIPGGEGLIAQVWERQEFVALEIAWSPGDAGDAYAAEQLRAGVPVATANNFRMRSVSYRGFPVTTAHESPGVLIFESTTPGRYSRDVTFRGRLDRDVEDASLYLTICIVGADEAWAYER